MTNINQSKFKKATEVFNSVYDKYDIMNDLMSFGTHRIWKKRFIDWMNPKENEYLLDVASGTGDIAKAFITRTKNRSHVCCVDPNNFMLSENKKRLKSFSNISWHHAQAEKLPFKNETFDIYAVSFGARNFYNLKMALKEAHRVLKIGGRFMCLEFSKIDNEILNKIYSTYSKSIPFLGKYIVGDSEPYEYLIDSIEKFYNQDELKRIILESGFNEVQYRNLSGGIVAIHSGWKI